jgi:DNA repair protein RadC
MKNKLLSVKIVKLRMVREGTAIYNAKFIQPEAVVNMLHSFFFSLDRESVVIVGLNNQNMPNVIQEISRGTIDQASIFALEVFKPLVLANCRSFICLHNHTSSEDLKPSDCDLKITTTLKDAGKLLRIDLLDHIIVSPKCNYYSLSVNGMIK